MTHQGSHFEHINNVCRITNTCKKNRSSQLPSFHTLFSISADNNHSKLENPLRIPIHQYYTQYPPPYQSSPKIIAPHSFVPHSLDAHNIAAHNIATHRIPRNSIVSNTFAPNTNNITPNSSGWASSYSQASSQLENDMHVAIDSSIQRIRKTSSISSSRSSSHGTKSPRYCSVEGCTKSAKAGRLCISHGGGARCSVAGCGKHMVTKGLCISHGGGKKCSIEGCNSAARKQGLCWSHGGNRLCRAINCNKGAKAGGFCWIHGGGKCCAVENCNRSVYRVGYCWSHRALIGSN